MSSVATARLAEERKAWRESGVPALGVDSQRHLGWRLVLAA